MAVSLKAFIESLVVRGAFSNLILVDLDTGHMHLVMFTPGALTEDLRVTYMLEHNVISITNADLATNIGAKETLDQLKSIINYQNQVRCMATVNKGRMIKIGFNHSDKPLDMTFKLKEYYNISTKTPMYNKETHESYVGSLSNTAIAGLKKTMGNKDPNKWVIDRLKFTFPEERDKAPSVDIAVSRPPKIFSHDKLRASDLWEFIVTGEMY